MDSTIEINTKKLMSSLPPGVLLVAACKTRSFQEINSSIKAGINIIGYNYLQEAEKMYPLIGDTVSWYMIGHLQKNKVARAVRLFDMIETIDSFELAKLIDHQCQLINKNIPVLIEINSGKESNKTGILPEQALELVLEVSTLSNLKVKGVMTMGPRFGNPKDATPYFQVTRSLYDKIKDAKIPNVDMKYLSMGMSNSYEVAIKEGANIIRIGTKLFGERTVDVVKNDQGIERN